MTTPKGTAQIGRAAEAIRNGKLVAFPTETVYGLGADATNDDAVAAIFAAKGRPHFNPLITHIASKVVARDLAVFDPRAEKLMDAFWPGALTLVLPRSPNCPISLLTSAGLETIALRMPAHPLGQALIHEAGRPIAAPSANPAGKLSPTSAKDVHKDLGGKVDFILDGGPCEKGLESTILRTAPEGVYLLRPGAIPKEEIEAVVGPLLTPTEPQDKDQPQVAPGQLTSHYAPNATLRLNAQTPYADEAFLAFGPNKAVSCKTELNLSDTGDLTEAAANLFHHLRALDASGAAQIAVMPIPGEGLGEAINDRLTRAAAPR